MYDKECKRCEGHGYIYIKPCYDDSGNDTMCPQCVGTGIKKGAKHELI